jgi:D-tyrosyl-tRNA(Tyr) deacylase
MRAVVQRVTEARVRVEGHVVGAIERGFLVLLGVGARDTEADADWMAGKILGLRVFGDAQGKMNLSIEDVGGAVLVVSQFTLYGDCRKGRRPSFSGAMAPEAAPALVQSVVVRIQAAGVRVSQGRFGADMAVELVNDGPVTLLLDSEKTF